MTTPTPPPLDATENADLIMGKGCKERVHLADDDVAWWRLAKCWSPVPMLDDWRIVRDEITEE